LQVTDDGQGQSEFLVALVKGEPTLFDQEMNSAEVPLAR
jgi:hypothetical protein